MGSVTVSLDHVTSEYTYLTAGKNPCDVCPCSWHMRMRKSRLGLISGESTDTEFRSISSMPMGHSALDIFLRVIYAAEGLGAGCNYQAH